MRPNIIKAGLCSTVSTALVVALSGLLPVSAHATPPPTTGDQLAGKTVFLDPGHQGSAHTENLARQVDNGRGGTKDCQTTGMTTLRGVPEHTINWDVAQLVKVSLQALGAQVVLSRADDTGWGGCVDDRARAANQSGAEVAVSIHADSAGADQRGFHLIVPQLPIPDAAAERAQAGAGLAASTSVRDAYLAAGFPAANYAGVSQGLQTRADVAGPALTHVPLVFVEMGNGANAADAALLESREGQLKHALAITTGIVGYLLDTPVAHAAPAFVPAAAPEPAPTGSEATPGAPGDDPANGTPGDEPVDNAPTEQPANGAPAGDPADGTPPEAPADGAPTEEPTNGAPGDEPAGGPSTGESADGTPTEEPVNGAPSDEPADGAAAEEPADGTPAEAPADGTPPQEPADGAAAEEPATEPAVAPVPARHPVSSDLGLPSGSSGQLSVPGDEPGTSEPAPAQQSPVAPKPPTGSSGNLDVPHGSEVRTAPPGAPSKPSAPAPRSRGTNPGTEQAPEESVPDLSSLSSSLGGPVRLVMDLLMPLAQSLGMDNTAITNQLINLAYTLVGVVFGPAK